MERLRLDHFRALSRFLQGLYAFRNLDGFVAYTLENLPKLVSSEITVYAELNHRRRRHKMVGAPLNIFTPACMEVFSRYAHEHPFFEHPRGGGDGSAVKITDLITRRQFHRLGIYNESFRPYAIDCEMLVWLPAPPGTEISFAVHRRRTDFSESDRLLLNLLRPHLVQAYRNAEAVTLLGQGVRAGGQAPVFLAPEGRIESADERSRQLICDYFGAIQPGDRLPEPLARWVRHQDSFLESSGDGPPPLEPVMVEREARRLVLRLLRGPARRLLLLEERSTSVVPRELEALGLTRREAEVLGWVAQGKTNDVIATILGLSYRTVEKHLENILRKLGVETRTAAAARVSGAASLGGAFSER